MCFFNVVFYLKKLFSNTLHDDCDDGINTLLNGVDKVISLEGFHCIPLSSWLSWLIKTGITLF
jgi:hypothetical protein